MLCPRHTHACRGTRLRLFTLDTTPASPHLVLVSPGPASSNSAGKKKFTLSLAGVSVAAAAVRLKRMVHDDRGQCDDDDDGMGDASLEHRNIMACPCTNDQGDVVGVIEVSCPISSSFDFPAEKAVQALSAHTARAVCNTSLHASAAAGEVSFSVVTKLAARLLEPSQPLGVMAAAADEYIKTFGCVNVCIYTPEPGSGGGGGDLVCRVAAPAPGPTPPGRSQPQSTSLQVGVRIPSHIGSIGSAFTHNKHVIITDTTTDPRTSSATGLVASGAAPRTFACFPIRSSKSSAAALGVVQVFARHPSFFASHTVQHMQAAAGLLAAALAAAARVQRSVEHVSQGVPVAAGRVETCIMLSSTVCTLLKCERCVFYLYDPSSGCLVHWKSDAAQIVFPLERGLAGVCARSCVAFKVDYAYLDPNYDAEIDCQHDTSVRSILTCPLTNRVNALVGVVHAQNKMRGFFTRENMELLQSMASQLGETLCNNVQYHSMRHSVDVHVRVAQATQDLLRCDDMKSVLETGEMVGAEEHVTRHTSHVTRHTSHVTRHTSHVTRHSPQAPMLHAPLSEPDLPALFLWTRKTMHSSTPPQPSTNRVSLASSQSSSQQFPAQIP